jgi:hypothetical protein
MAFGTVLYDVARPGSTDSNCMLWWDGRTLWISDHKNTAALGLRMPGGVVVRSVGVNAEDVMGDPRFLWVRDGSNWRQTKDGVNVTGLRASASTPLRFYGSEILLWASGSRQVQSRHPHVYQIKQRFDLPAVGTFGAHACTHDGRLVYVVRTSDSYLVAFELDRDRAQAKIVREAALPTTGLATDGLATDGRAIWYGSNTTDRIYALSLN